MKKTFGIMAFLLSIATGLTSFADTATIDDIEWTYIVKDGEVQIGDGSSAAIPIKTERRIITIPSVIDNCPVTSIGDYAFKNCSRLASVTIPSSVTSIGRWAFAGTHQLVAINVEDDNANYKSENGLLLSKDSSSLIIVPGNLQNVTVPSNVTGIEDYAFENCINLKSVTISDGVLTIGDGAFFGCNCLTSVTIPDSVNSIGRCAFEYCSGMTKVTIGNNVTNIGDYAFGFCDSLQSVIWRGDVPAVMPMEEAVEDCDVFDGANEELVNYVPKTSSGWGEVWQGRQVVVYDPLKTYKVTFSIGVQGRLVSGEQAQNVGFCESAIAPEIEALEGWFFAGWDSDFSQVREDLTVSAIWLKFADIPEGWSYLGNLSEGVMYFADGSLMISKIDDNIACGVQFTTSGPGKLSFKWKVSSEEDSDYAEVLLDDESMEFISGIVKDWQEVSIEVEDAGNHVWALCYNKDGVDAAGEDIAWFKDVVWTPSISGSLVDIQWRIARFSDEMGVSSSAGQCVGYFVPTFVSSGTLPTIDYWMFISYLQNGVIPEDVMLGETLNTYRAGAQFNGLFTANIDPYATISGFAVVFNAPYPYEATSFFVTDEQTLEIASTVGSTTIQFGSVISAMWQPITWEPPYWQGSEGCVRFEVGEHGTLVNQDDYKQIVSMGNEATLPVVEVEEGWRLIGWYCNAIDNLFEGDTIPVNIYTVSPEDGYMVLEARYEKVLPKWTVTFDPGKHGTRTGGGALTQLVEEGSAAIAPIVSGSQGWVFVGWDVAFNEVTDNLSVTALYKFAPAVDYSDVYDGMSHTINTALLFETAVSATEQVSLTILYSSNTNDVNSWSEEAPMWTNASSNTVWYKIIAENFLDTINESKVIIKKRPVTFTSASGTWTYDGQAHSNTTVIVGGKGFVSGEGANYSGFLTITAVDEIANAFDVTFADSTKESNYVVTKRFGKLRVTEAASPFAGGANPDVANSDWDEARVSMFDYVGEYDGVAHTIWTNELVTAMEALKYDGLALTIQYASGINPPSVNETWDTIAPSFVDVGTNMVWYKVSADNCADYIHAAKVIVWEAPYPAVDYLGLYDGEEHTINTDLLFDAAMIASGSENPRILYSSNTNDVSAWSEEVPMWTNAGTNSVWYKVCALNYMSSVHESKVIIKKRSVILTSADGTWTYDGQAHGDSAVCVSGDGFVLGEGAEYVGFNMKSEVGSAYNYFTAIAQAGTDFANYIITYAYGILSVIPAEDPFDDIRKVVRSVYITDAAIEDDWCLNVSASVILDENYLSSYDVDSPFYLVVSVIGGYDRDVLVYQGRTFSVEQNCDTLALHLSVECPSERFFRVAVSLPENHSDYMLSDNLIVCRTASSEWRVDVVDNLDGRPTREVTAKDDFWFRASEPLLVGSEDCIRFNYDLNYIEDCWWCDYEDEESLCAVLVDLDSKSIVRILHEDQIPNSGSFDLSINDYLYGEISPGRYMVGFTWSDINDYGYYEGLEDDLFGSYMMVVESSWPGCWSATDIFGEDGTTPKEGQFIGYFVATEDETGTLPIISRNTFASMLRNGEDVSAYLDDDRAATTTFVLGDGHAMLYGQAFPSFGESGQQLSGFVVVLNAANRTDATSFFVTNEMLVEFSSLGTVECAFGSQDGVEWQPINPLPPVWNGDDGCLAFNAGAHGHLVNPEDAEMTVPMNSNITSPKVVVDDGWRLTGWFCEESGVFYVGETIPVNENTVSPWTGRLPLVAQYEEAPYPMLDYLGEYDGEAHTIDTTLLLETAKKVTGDEAVVILYSSNINDANAWSEEVPMWTNVGVNTVWFKVMAENFTGAVHDARVIIEKRSITFTSADEIWTYDGQAHSNITVTVGGKGFVDSEGATYSGFSTITSVGEKDNAFDVTFVDPEKEINYEVTKSFGKLKVTVAASPFVGGVDPDVANPDCDDVRVSMFDYVGEYDGVAHTIHTNKLVAAMEDLKYDGLALTIEYASGDNPPSGRYQTWHSLSPCFTDVGTNTVWYKVSAQNCTDYIHAAKVIISPATVSNSPTVSCSSAKLQSDKIELTCVVDGIASTNVYKFGVAISNAVTGVERVFPHPTFTSVTPAVDGSVANGNYSLLWNATADLGDETMQNASVKVFVYSGHVGVQLWENGPYWAECNVGAEQQEEAGLYFWWGDTVGYNWVCGDEEEEGKWVASDGSNDDFSFEADNVPTFGLTFDQLQTAGWTQGDVLAPAHDAATVHWGNGWRMPTLEELSTLNNSNFCAWTWIIDNGANGYSVSGQGVYANDVIYMPTAGVGVGSSIVFQYSDGYYISSTLDISDSCSPWSLWLNCGYNRDIDCGSVALGYTVRPVADFTSKRTDGAYSVYLFDSIYLSTAVDLTDDEMSSNVLPEISKDATTEEVTEILSGATDPALLNNITTVSDYQDFRNWAKGTTSSGGGNAGSAAVMASDMAWFSFAIDSPTLVKENITKEDVKIDTLTPTTVEGHLDFTVEIDGVEIGDAATEKRLKTVFGIEGATSLDIGAFSSENVTLETVAPEGGKAKFSVRPKDSTSGSFFMRVRVNR